MVKFLMFSFLWIFIGLVSAYDAFLNLKYPVTVEIEKNPVAKHLLSNVGFVELFGLKFAGTIIALGILAVLYKISDRIAFSCAVPLSMFQCFLLYYFWS